MGRLFWGNDKQCYSADAVFRKVQELLSQEEKFKDKEGERRREYEKSM